MTTVHDVYSKRNKEVIDVFVYQDLSKKLKTQIVYIWEAFLKQLENKFIEGFWDSTHLVLCREHGERSLASGGFTQISKVGEVVRYFDKLIDTDKCLDIIETIFGLIERSPIICEKNNIYYPEVAYTPKNAIKDLNIRFLENGYGFEFYQGKIIRVDNKILHSEIIQPTLIFLSNKLFENANEEFLNAHMHFRHGRNKECLAECLKALETTLKIICYENDWKFDPEKDTAIKLIGICFEKELIPKYLQTHFSALRTTLESGVPTLRNKKGGHGQGVTKIEVPPHLASYMLYLTGTSINFLVSSHKELKAFE